MNFRIKILIGNEISMCSIFYFDLPQIIPFFFFAYRDAV